jgi:histidine triad (HIT) family protein
MDDCIFCDIVNGDSPASIIFEDQTCVVFMDIQPVNLGHALVIPKVHASSLSELDPDIGGHLFQASQRTAQAIRRSQMRCEGINLFLADGEAAGQDVFHVHLHVIPRYSGDGFGFNFSDQYWQKPSREELDASAKIIIAGFVEHQPAVEAFWRAYTATLSEGAQPPDFYDVWSFGDTEEMADELGQLVQAGIKTATCSLMWEYESERNEDLPKAGDVSVITDGQGAPLCVIETVEVEVKPFGKVDEVFAYDEGEGERSLAYWRNAHWDFFTRVCGSIGREPVKTMPLICERFRVVFPR